MLIPPELGYGDGLVHPQTGNLLIPGGKILIFEVELQAVH
jgi:FKBP-type peptidyl-prolyl cis-trans isomerase